jgi:tetratricopeptide (TPR) repeat protein
MESRRFVRPLLALLILFAAENLFADWYEDYSEGLKLIEKKEWQIAVLRLQSAVRESDDETAIALHVRTRITYFPHFYLGIAYYNLKMYPAAISEFEKSEKDGAIRSRSTLLLQMSILKKLALEQIAKSPPAVSDTPAPTNEVQQPPQTPSAPPPAPVTTNLPQKDPNKAPVELPVSKPNQPSVDLKPEAPTLADESILRDKLKQGARQYFEGNFDGAIASLQSALQMNARSASAQFLLGCAYASKYLLAGPENRQLLNKASDAFRKARRIDPQFAAIHSSYMSPAVLRIYQNVQ